MANEPNEPIKYVVCCPKCKTKLNEDLHKRNSMVIHGEDVKAWYCPYCGHEMDEPVRRTEDFFEKQIGMRTIRKKDPVTHESYAVEMPIRRKFKKKFDTNKIITYEELCEELKGYVDRNKFRRLFGIYLKRAAFIAFLYMTGARVSEVTGIKAVDEQGHVIQQYVVEPVKIEDIKIVIKKNVPFLLITNMPVLKRRGGLTVINNEIAKAVMRRNVYINMEKERILVDILRMYMTKRSMEKTPNPYLFNISRQSGRVYSRHLKLTAYPHLMRHQRATDLIRRYEFNSTQLMFFFGWADEKQAKTYSHLNDEDMVNSMM